MTEQQQQAVGQVCRLMKENFDSFILTYRITDENLGSKIHHEWHGHLSDVVGLAAITQHRLGEITSLRGVPDATKR
jgi:hypothetical protein